MTTLVKNKYAVPALDKGLDILEYLGSCEQPQSQAEIAHVLDRSPNEIYRILIGLEKRGYLIRNEQSGKYTISLKIYTLSRRISSIDKISQCALPHMEDLAFSSGHSCYLSMLYQSQTMIILQARSHESIAINMAEGALFPTVLSAAGKILLANSNDIVKHMILERSKDYASWSANNQTRLEIQLEEIRKNGFFIEKNQIIPNISDIAVLIGKPEGKIIASLSISPIQTNTPIDHDMLISQLKLTALNISKQLGL